MSVSFGWIAVAAAIAAFLSANLILAAGSTSFAIDRNWLGLYVFGAVFMTLVAWPFCCFALAYAQWLAQRPMFAWLWRPELAVPAGLISGLALGLPLTFATQTPWWLGGVFGAMSALAFSILAKWQGVRS